MKIKKDELREEIRRISEIQLEAKKCFKYSSYLYNPETQDESNYLNSHKDLRFMRHVIWKMSIIELSKLISKSKNRDRFNLHHLINKLKKDQYYGDIGIESLKVSKWQMALEKHQNLINNILILRDKSYAHTDSEMKNIQEYIPLFGDLKILIELAEEIISEIYSSVFNTHYHFEDNAIDGRKFNIIKILSEEKKRKIDDRVKEISDKKIEFKNNFVKVNY